MAYDNLRLSNNVSILVELSNDVWITTIGSIFATFSCRHSTINLIIITANKNFVKQYRQLPLESQIMC